MEITVPTAIMAIQHWSSRRDDDPDWSVHFWPAGSGFITFSLDPEPGPTCNNGLIKLFSSWKKIYNRINKFKLKMMVYKVEFYVYLRKLYIYFILHFKSRSDPEKDPDFQLSRIQIQGNNVGKGIYIIWQSTTLFSFKCSIKINRDNNFRKSLNYQDKSKKQRYNIILF